MIDPRREVILTRVEGELVDATRTVVEYSDTGDDRIAIVFRNRPTPYRYARANARVLTNGRQLTLPPESKVEVRGAIWESATEVWTFGSREDVWTRVFYRTQGGESYRTYPASQVLVIENAGRGSTADEVLGYWQQVVARLAADDPLRRSYSDLTFIHPESILAQYLSRAPVASREFARPVIFPFRCNLSQRVAVSHGLTRSLSVIEGPPGTGKTETILNLIANIAATEGGSVGVVSFNNAAVDNVRKKLTDAGFGHIIANLGKAEKRKQFFSDRAARNAADAAARTEVPAAPPAWERLKRVDERLQELQTAERTCAELHSQVDAFRLELQHFELHLGPEAGPDLDGLPLLRRSSERILRFLAESGLEQEGARPGLLGRVRQYIQYGSRKGLDAGDTEVVLGLQRAFYHKRIAELEGQIHELEQILRSTSFQELADKHQSLSITALRAALSDRYSNLPEADYDASTYKQGAKFEIFKHEYPVVLSTCHALRDSIPAGYLLDYLIIDEASQVDLLAAGLALSCCRNLVVVGDRRQLPHMPAAAAKDLAAPIPAYDYQRHNILSSLLELYGDDLPRTLLREHYRCDPAINGFCNKYFYDGELIPFSSRQDERPMVVVRTAEGNHHRKFREGGRFNRREVEVIHDEVIPKYCQGVAGAEIGITTPYRRQADTVTDALIKDVEADTVHKFQGRQKDVVILTTVLDETREGHLGLRFADDPRLVNVAVSRAAKKFILVTNHDLMPKSRRIKDLIGYILYQDPNEKVVDSVVVSIFDLLYREYSPLLRPLAARLKGGMTYKTEQIASTVLQEILDGPDYAHLTLTHQVLVRNLLPNLDGLSADQVSLVRNRASVDFVVYNKASNHPLLAIEVDGFAFHANNPVQLARDALKDEIFRIKHIPLLRLPTTGSGEESKIRDELRRADPTIRGELEHAETHWERVQSELLANQPQ